VIGSRIVVFTGDLSHSVRAGIVAIDGAIDGVSWLIVVHSPIKQATIVLRNQIRNLRTHGWRWVPYQATDVIRRFSVAVDEHPSPGTPGCDASDFGFAMRANVRIERVPDIHSESATSMIRAFQPDLGLSLAAPILREKLFSIPVLGTYNLHKGKVPDYRGMPAAFWELWNDEVEVGCTVHRVDSGLDTGDVIASTAVVRQEYSDLRGLQLSLDSAGIRLMRDAVSRLLQGDVVASPQARGGKTYRKPTLRQVAILTRRIRERAARRTAPKRRFYKECAYQASTMSWHLGARHIARPRVKVLLYHRVTDEVRDNLTVGIAQFDRQMAFLRSHCRVLSIEEVIRYDVIPKSDRPLVCVTFDDGYLDNVQNAMPILARHCIPAAFFVSTGIVGTERSFPHDIARGNSRPAAMSWNDVSELHRNGFTVGSHSVSHIDCAAEPEDVVAAELRQSMDALRTRLGLSEVLFAYPYGGKANMTAERLRLVERVGYKACLSAYGGTNVGRIDPYNVVRGGIHWEMSDRSFRFQCLGLL
jgi:peptidoglycan/xylan/chitin deacetylase (PgdA/CDA1 family)